MKIKKHAILLIITALTLATLACATLTGGGSTPEVVVPTTISEPGGETATQPPATSAPETSPEETVPTPAGDNEPGQNSGTDSINLDDPLLYIQPDGINTYRASLVFTFSGQAADGTAVTGSITGDGAYSVEPYQVSFKFQTSDTTIPGGGFEFVQIDNTFYMSSADFGCLQLPAGDSQTDNPYEALLDTGGTLTGFAQRIDDDTINDTPVYVYEITNANIDVSDPTAQQIDEITFGRIYIAKDGGYVVRVVLDGRGKNTLLTENNDISGDVHYELNYFGHNQPVDIVPPADCESTIGGETGEGSDIPIPEGAADLVSFPGLISFSSTQSVEELADYYKTELAAAGWTLDNDFTVPGVSTLQFSKDGSQATIIITEDQSTGNTLVAITEGP